MTQKAFYFELLFLEDGCTLTLYDEAETARDIIDFQEQGTARVVTHIYEPALLPARAQSIETCPACNGGKRVGTGQTCPICKGKGSVRVR